MNERAKLKGALVAKGYTYDDMAHTLGISRTTVNAKMNGKSVFTVAEAAAISEWLSLSDREKVEFFLD